MGFFPPPTPCAHHTSHFTCARQHVLVLAHAGARWRTQRELFRRGADKPVQVEEILEHFGPFPDVPRLVEAGRAGRRPTRKERPNSVGVVE